ncbi:MAG TPA: chromosome segregation protein SMC [Nocardioidaceae bacterium]|nr:chromosome segregation protein SMC [Nocardioidaceae bacterium]
MYLKSLTLRGFKSFASTTTLQLEPGITCIVGPNGSGKSNVVDALAWVMGEQGAKSLRGGKMEDVIFAGTSGRSPLGRAEVLLTIDNADGALPIEYAEVTISRTMFRNGGSDYAINGQTCRLLDVQELLSDSGIGREMHVIVGQGQLDAILRASPEERRGFIEEAAGVLKHRRRKEKALRKLDATDGNLTRLGDLLGEIRRQLKPLGRQAEVTRRASVVQLEARDARARLLADDAVTLRDILSGELADEAALAQRRADAERALADNRRRESELEGALMQDAPLLATAQDTWFSLAAVRERLRGTAILAAERVRSASDVPDEAPRQDPEELVTQADLVRAEEAEIGRQIASCRERLEAAVTERQTREFAYAAEDRRVSQLLRAGADRREGLARLTGQVNTVRSRSAAAEDEVHRLEAARHEALARGDRARREFTALETRIAGLDAGEHGLDAEYSVASALVADLDARLTKLKAEAETAERERGALAARRDALELGLGRKDGAHAVLSAGETLSGVLGSLAALVSVPHQHQVAVAAALGAAADAAVVANASAAYATLAYLKSEDLGRAGLVLADSPPHHRASWPQLGPRAMYVVDVIEAPASVRPALEHLLSRRALVDDVAAAQALLAEHPDLVAVTGEGDVVDASFALGGSSAQPSLLELQAAIRDTADAIEAAVRAGERMRFEQSALEAERTDAQGRADVALARLHESDATMAAIAEELGHLGAQARAAKAEAARIDAAIDGVRDAHASDLAELRQLEERLAAAEGGADEEPDVADRERLAEEARTARQRETEARLALRTAEERGRALRGRADALERAAEHERTARAVAAMRRERRVREARTAEVVGRAAQAVLARLEVSLEAALQRRTAVESARADRESQLSACRREVRVQEAEVAELTSSVHRDELLRAEHRLRSEQLEQRCLDEFGFGLDTLVSEYGPTQPVPPTPALPGEDRDEDPEPTAYVREEQQRRLRSAEAALAQLGRINPLALEEFDALEQRHKFLSEQLEDLKKTRRDLLDIVTEVDARVEEVFTSAYRDVAREFEELFARLFPGGEGKLVLTEPDDMLTSGIEVEARPAGKKIKRLSLLSGGERSLVAVTFLVALFRARPSPFYILDEVEAALDDTNLGRLLAVYEELREASQLVVITHQKRTMQVADALYGVTMRGDGVSAVISQRLREPERV